MAIYGIGVDIVEINRIEKAINRWKRRFVKRIFTKEEISYCVDRANPYQCFAARFAAKEAVLKAFGTGWGGGIRWLDIEIVNSRRGKPRVRVKGEANQFMKMRSLKKISISLSHSKEYAAAFAIIEN